MAEGGLGTAPARVRETPATGSTSGVADASSATNHGGRTQTSCDEQGVTGLAVNLSSAKLQQASVRFFVVTGLSLLEALFFSLSDVKVAVACGVVAVTFGVLGALAHRLNKTLILIGLGLYVAETAVLLVDGWNTNMIMVAYGVFVHCAVLYRLYLSYGTIGDLQTA